MFKPGHLHFFSFDSFDNLTSKASFNSSWIDWFISSRINSFNSPIFENNPFFPFGRIDDDAASDSTLRLFLEGIWLSFGLLYSKKRKSMFWNGVRDWLKSLDFFREMGIYFDFFTNHALRRFILRGDQLNL